MQGLGFRLAQQLLRQGSFVPSNLGIQYFLFFHVLGDDADADSHAWY